MNPRPQIGGFLLLVDNSPAFPIFFYRNHVFEKMCFFGRVCLKKSNNRLDSV